MKNSKKFLSILTHAQQLQFAVLIILMFFGTILEILSIGLVLPVMTIILNPEKIIAYAEYLIFIDEPATFILSDRFPVWALTIMLFAYIVKGVILLLISWYQTKYAFSIQESLSNRLYLLYLGKDWSFHTTTNSSIIIRNVVGEVATFVSNYVLPMLTFMIEAMVLIGVGLLLIFIEPIGSAVTISFLLISVIIFNYVTKPPLIRWGKLIQKAEKERILNIQHMLGCIKEIQLMSDTTLFKKKYAECNFTSANNLRKNTFFQALPRVYIEILAISGVVILAASIISEETSQLVPVLGLFAAAAFRIMPSSTRLITSLQYIQNSSAVLDNLCKELSTEIDTESEKITSEFEFKKSIKLNCISFNHNANSSFKLKNINLTIEKGSSIGLVGQSGSGKSTLIDLILGLLQPSNGKILVDGFDINKNLKGWQSNIGYIPQDIYLLDDTIRNNIALGLAEREIDDNRIWSVLEQAQLKQLIEGFPAGLNTIVGEHGSKLSGGQLQRIGIARALYCDPEIIVLDEATSALDQETEDAVLETFSALKGAKTLIVITHRYNALSVCDKVFEIRNGTLSLSLNYQ